MTALFLEWISTYLKICSFSKSSSSCKQVTDLSWSEAEPRALFSKKYCLKIASKTLHWYQWEVSQLKVDEEKMSWGFWKASQRWTQKVSPQQGPPAAPWTALGRPSAAGWGRGFCFAQRWGTSGALGLSSTREVDTPVSPAQGDKYGEGLWSLITCLAGLHVSKGSGCQRQIWVGLAPRFLLGCFTSEVGIHTPPHSCP